ncbi:GrpB family protein [Desulfovibrio inopinatus]|uniref:GrpB family protein n=1 Tax=Desulfovibrio inopinatus TaxID=102109 RepID=UPI0004895FDA|nr:GrpB family protein [Desulfovibrio inopinatus]
MTKETLAEKIARVTAEIVMLSAYDPAWPSHFEEEKRHLEACLPADLIIRIEHIGSTAIPGLIAKPIIDMLIEITDVERGKRLIPEILESQGYDCFWRPHGNRNIPPYYTWCIKRASNGTRTHHLHIDAPRAQANKVRFRDILLANPERAHEYANLKQRLELQHKNNRIAYTTAKGSFIQETLDDENIF